MFWCSNVSPELAKENVHVWIEVSNKAAPLEWPPDAKRGFRHESMAGGYGNAELQTFRHIRGGHGGAGFFIRNKFDSDLDAAARVLF